MDKHIHLHTSGSSVGSGCPEPPNFAESERGISGNQSLSLWMHYLAILQGRFQCLSGELGGKALNFIVALFCVCDTFYEYATIFRIMSCDVFDTLTLHEGNKKCVVTELAACYQEIRQVRFAPVCQQYLLDPYWSVLEQMRSLALMWWSRPQIIWDKKGEQLWGLMENIMLMDLSDCWRGRQLSSFAQLLPLSFLLCHASWLTSLLPLLSSQLKIW